MSQEGCDWAVYCDTDVGTIRQYPYLSQGAAEQLAAALQRCEDERRQRAPDPTLRSMPEAFNVYSARRMRA